MWIVIIEIIEPNLPVEISTVYGPFETEEAATKWASDCPFKGAGKAGHTYNQCLIMEVTKPTT